MRAFRSDYAKYTSLGASLVGVSNDDVKSHKGFCDKESLPFPLLADTEGEIARAFGVPASSGAVKRVTFLIDERGVIRKVWPRVLPWGHSRQILDALAALR